MASVSLEQVADLLRAAMSPTPDIRSEAERMLEGTVRGTRADAPLRLGHAVLGVLGEDDDLSRKGAGENRLRSRLAGLESVLLTAFDRVTLHADATGKPAHAPAGHWRFGRCT
jgi:hypothetical protein